MIYLLIVSVVAAFTIIIRGIVLGGRAKEDSEGEMIISIHNIIAAMLMISVSIVFRIAQL